MSLFKTQELWSFDLNIADAFDNKSLQTESINGRSCIFVGSHDGFLRIYSPITDEPTFYKPSDLLYETLFTSPVLQMAMACLVSGSNRRQLAILHPRSLAIYGCQFDESDNGSVVTLQHIYQHSLQRPAYGFITGSFGRVKGRHFTCVLSLDGMLTFFEQESPTFETQLPDFLLPTPFCYLPETDVFIFQNADRYIISYSYEELSQTTKTMKSNWSHNLGESIKDIQCVLLNGDQENIYILTDKYLYTMNDEGQIVGVKIMDYQPICFYNFENKATGKIMSIVCAENKTINIFEGSSLKWSSNLEVLPIAVSRIDLGKLHGTLTLLTDSGFVQCVYFGTVPSIYLIPPTAEPDIDIAAAEQQLRSLHSQITDTEVNRSVEDILNVNLNVDRVVSINADRVSCSVNLHLSALTPVNNIQILIIVEPPLVSSIANTIVPSVVNSETVSAKVFVEGAGLISGLQVKAIVSFVMPNGAPRVIEKSDVLPLEVAMKLCAAEKESPVKLTIATNKATCALNQLFPGDLGSANAIGLQYLNGESIVSIVAAKTSQRYRVQGETLEHLSLVVSCLIDRLRYHHRREFDLSFTFTGPLPISPYYQQIQQHFNSIDLKRKNQERLAQSTTQYRTLQKKMLGSLKDVQPKPMGALHKVLDETYQMIRKVTMELEETEERLSRSRRVLTAHHRLLLALLSIMSLSPQDLALLQVAFNPAVQDSVEQGWLEIHYATLSLLLRTELAKSSKDQNKPRPLSLEPITDVSLVCKLISSVLDRATKGALLMERAEFNPDREALATIHTVKELEAKEVTIIPKAVKFMDLTVIPADKAKPPNILKDKSAEKSKNENKVETQATIEIRAEALEEAKTELISALKIMDTPKKATKEDVGGLKIVDAQKKVALEHISQGDKIGKSDNEKSKAAEDSIWDIDIDDVQL